MKRVSIAIMFIIITIVSNAWAFNRNLSGTWKNGNDTWTIVHVGSNAVFSTSGYVDDIGLLSLVFSGNVSDGGDDDSFEYSGDMEERVVRLAGRRCVMGGIMDNAGYVSGEFGGRIIHMDRCSIRVNFRCQGTDRRFTTRLDCGGTWR